MWPVIYRTSMPPTETSTGHRPPSNLPPGPPRSALPPLVVPQCPLSRAANADRSDRQHAQGKQPPCGAAIANGTFSPPGFRLRLGHKDAAAVGGRVRPKRPDAVRQPDHGRFTTSLNKGRADLDWSALTVEVFQAAGLT